MKTRFHRSKYLVATTLLAFGSTLLVGACDADPDAFDVDDPEIEGQSGCTIGTDTVATCKWQATGSALWSPNAAGWIGQTFSSYGPGTCPERAVVRTRNTASEVWFDQVAAYVPAANRPTTQCGCENLLISLEYEDYACTPYGTTSCTISGQCFDGDFNTGEACCPPAGDTCPADESCQGFTPGLYGRVCDYTSRVTVRKTVAGSWDGTQCRGGNPVIDRWDVGGGDEFEGKLPQFRAGAIDRISGTEYPVYIKAIHLD